MRRFLVSLVALALGALALSACDAQVTPYAARVDGATVSQATLDAALNSVASDPGYRCVIETTSGGAANVTGAGPGTYNATFAAAVLSLLVEADALKVAVAKMHLLIGAFADQVARSQLPQNFGPPTGSTCSATGAEVFNGLSARYRTVLIGLQADEDVLAAKAIGVPLTTAGITAYESRHRKESTLECTRVIEVASKQKASELAIAIHSGVSFASVAMRNSIDSTSAPKGGSLGCILPATLVAPLGSVIASLRVGELSAPVAFQRDWLLFEVTSRSPDSLVDVATRAVLPAGTAKATAALARVVKAARVTVDPSYGTWTKVRGAFQVRPPSGPPLDLVPNPAAVGASSALG